MFTASMYDRLSEWLSNLSIGFLFTFVVPIFGGIDRIEAGRVLLGVILSFIALWLSLRLARISVGEKVKKL